MIFSFELQVCFLVLIPKVLIQIGYDDDEDQNDKKLDIIKQIYQVHMPLWKKEATK